MSANITSKRSERLLGGIHGLGVPPRIAAACFLTLVAGIVLLPEQLVYAWSLLTYGVLSVALVRRFSAEDQAVRGFWILSISAILCTAGVDAARQNANSGSDGWPPVVLAMFAVAALTFASFAAILALGPSVRFATLMRWASAAELVLASTFVQVWIVMLLYPSRQATLLTVALNLLAVALALTVVAQLTRSPSRPEGMGCLMWLVLLYVMLTVTGFLVEVGYPPRVHGMMRLLGLYVGLRAMAHPQFPYVGRLAGLDLGNEPVSIWRRIMFSATFLNPIVAWLVTHGYQSRVAVTVAVFALTLGIAVITRRSAPAPYSLAPQGRGSVTSAARSGRAKDPTPIDVMVEEFAAALLDGQLTLHYQPVIDARTSEVVGAEALLRWSHPQGIDMPPDLILHLARVGAISRQLEDWILEQAIADAHDLADALLVGGTLSYLGVNITAEQLEHPLLVDKVAGLLSRYDVAAESLVLELTEHEEVRSLTAASASIAGLRDLGVAIALDDFGSGVANIDVLTHLSFDVIKLDRTFVLGLSVPEKSSMMEDSLQAVQRLGSRLVLEGVEDGEDEAVRQLMKQVDYVQGYAFGQPMPLAELRRISWQEAS